MKACPYCGEVYQDTAFVCLKCRHDFRNPSQRASVAVPRATKHAKIVRSTPKPQTPSKPILERLKEIASKDWFKYTAFTCVLFVLIFSEYFVYPVGYTSFGGNVYAGAKVYAKTEKGLRYCFTVEGTNQTNTLVLVKYQDGTTDWKNRSHFAYSSSPQYLVSKSSIQSRDPLPIYPE